MLFYVFYEASIHLKPKLVKAIKEKLQVNLPVNIEPIC